MEDLKSALEEACKKLFGIDIAVELSRPEEEFGDYSSNIALQLAGRLNKQPQAIAEALAAELGQLELVNKVEVADPGFINVWLTDEVLIKAAFSATHLKKPFEGQEIVLEHTDPNPFKEFHIGHAYSNTVGVSIGKLLDAAGAQIHQVSYHGDVGLHIAMAVWAIYKEIGSREVEVDINSLRSLLNVELGTYYAKGSRAYLNDLSARQEIEHINKLIYEQSDPLINNIYKAGRSWSLEVFEAIYKKLNTKFEKNYFESEVAEKGEKLVKENLGKIFIESEGAIIYDGEKKGLHKRVFITKQKLPTYETKEIGLAFAKNRDYPRAQKFIVITGNEIDDYFNVLLEAISDIDPGLSNKIIHIGHGMVRSVEGKMSSRTGNVKLFDSLVQNVKETIWKKFGAGKEVEEIVYGAIKYEFLKHRLGSSFIFNVDESVSLQGNSGPYLQYAYARARSILQKSNKPKNIRAYIKTLNPQERSLARKIGEYPEVAAKSIEELEPHYICTYLYELAQNFNRFYEKNRVVGSDRELDRIQLVGDYASVLRHGLGLLNIEAPERV